MPPTPSRDVPQGARRAPVLELGADSLSFPIGLTVSGNRSVIETSHDVYLDIVYCVVALDVPLPSVAEKVKA